MDVCGGVLSNGIIFSVIIYLFIAIFKELIIVFSLERDAKLGALEERADALQDGCAQFEKQAAAMKNKFWLENMKMIIAGSVVGLLVLGFIYWKFFMAPPPPAYPPPGAYPPPPPPPAPAAAPAGDSGGGGEEAGGGGGDSGGGGDESGGGGGGDESGGGGE